jgi:hypothetical protein
MTVSASHPALKTLWCGSIRRVKTDCVDMMGGCVYLHAPLFGAAVPHFSSCHSPVSRVIVLLGCRPVSRLGSPSSGDQQKRLFRDPFRPVHVRHNKLATLRPPRPDGVAVSSARSFGMTRLCLGSRPSRSFAFSDRATYRGAESHRTTEVNKQACSLAR